MLIAAILLAALAPFVHAQVFGVGGSVGLVNDVGNEFTLDRFKHSEVTGWVDYRLEKSSLLRLTYGSMRTQQTGQATITVPGPGATGDPAIPVTRPLKERVEYLTIGVSYLLWEGFFTSGLFAGIGGYHIRPDEVPPDFTGAVDRKETVVGWHVGSEAVLRLYKNLGLVGRVTYHNVSAHPHRQWVNVDAGVAARF
jgi:hypothetical protein